MFLFPYICKLNIHWIHQWTAKIPVFSRPQAYCFESFTTLLNKTVLQTNNHGHSAAVKATCTKNRHPHRPCTKVLPTSSSTNSSAGRKIPPNKKGPTFFLIFFFRFFPSSFSFLLAVPRTMRVLSEDPSRKYVRGTVTVQSGINTARKLWGRQVGKAID